MAKRKTVSNFVFRGTRHAGLQPGCKTAKCDTHKIDKACRVHGCSKRRSLKVAS